jgi:predicted nuclease with TOPRIM domain
MTIRNHEQRIGDNERRLNNIDDRLNGEIEGKLSQLQQDNERLVSELENERQRVDELTYAVQYLQERVS